MTIGFIFECGPQGADKQVCEYLAGQLKPGKKIISQTMDNKLKLYGFNNLVDGWVPDKLTSNHERPEKLQAIQRAVDRGFKFSEPAKPSKPVNDK